MGLFNKFPYTDLNNINLDVTLTNINNLIAEGNQLYTALRAWQNQTIEENQLFKTQLLNDISTWETNLNASLEAWKGSVDQSVIDQITAAKAELLAYADTVLAGAVEAKEDAEAAAEAAADAQAAAEAAEDNAEAAQEAAEAVALNISGSTAQITENTADISDLENTINIFHDLVNYNYDTRYFRNPDPSENNSLKLGIKRDNIFITLNGTLNYSDSHATRVRINGPISSTISSSTPESWTTNTVSLITGHKYKLFAQLISGTATTFPALGVTYSGSASYISTGIRPTAESYSATFTAEENKTYNVCLSCTKNTTFTNAKFYVVLYDLTAEELSLEEEHVQIDANTYSLEYGLTRIWHSADFTNGYYSAKSITVTTTEICVKQPIPVAIGDVISIKKNPDNWAFTIGVYISSSNSLQHSTGWITGETYDYICQDNGTLIIQFANAVLFNDRTDIIPADMRVIFGFPNTGYIITSILKNSTAIKSIINSKTKTIAFLGDSLTAGVGTNKIYHMYIGDRFGYTCKNYGYGGSGYARSYPSTGGKMATGQTGMGDTITSSNQIIPNDFYTRIQTIPDTIDGLIIFGGTNDWAHGDDISFADFQTAVRNVFSYAQTTYDKKPIIVLSPIHRTGDNTPNSITGKTLKDYCDEIKNICSEYGIIYIDLFSESGLNPSNANNNTEFYTRDDTGVSDGLHPNHYAHMNIANLLATILITKMYEY